MVYPVNECPLIFCPLAGLAYGDYPPVSREVVETVYLGEDYDGLVEAVRSWNYSGGTPMRDALHEGLAQTLLVPMHPCSFHVSFCS